jgi:hypothetical protein
MDSHGMRELGRRLNRQQVQTVVCDMRERSATFRRQGFGRRPRAQGRHGLCGAARRERYCCWPGPCDVSAVGIVRLELPVCSSFVRGGLPKHLAGGD